MTYRQLYKRANVLGDIKSGADKVWNSYNDYADKHGWVRPTVDGLAGAGIGAGLGSLGFLINPKTAKTLMFLLGGLGGLHGFKHGVLSNPNTMQPGAIRDAEPFQLHRIWVQAQKNHNRSKLEQE